MGKNYQIHRFFCIKCGNEGIPIHRKHGHQHSRFHRKKLYCPHCKIEVNHIECKCDEDVYDFKLDFEEGVYDDEVEESFSGIRASGLGQEYMDSGANP